MNKKITKYALGACVFLLISGSVSYEAQSAVLPQTIAYSEVSGQLSATAQHTNQPITQPVSQVSQAIVSQFTPNTNLAPIHITIPTAKVNAEIIPVGVTKTNNLDVPPNFVQTGWYKYGPLPGMPGNAVIDGHVDNAGSIDGPFKHLRDAKIGDLVQVAMSDGSTVTFKIVDTTVYLTSKFPAESVFHGNSASVLKIITCHGTYQKSMGTYDHRLIVTAVRVS